jgi:hypothetical protein
MGWHWFTDRVVLQRNTQVNDLELTKHCIRPRRYTLDEFHSLRTASEFDLNREPPYAMQMFITPASRVKEADSRGASRLALGKDWWLGALISPQASQSNALSAPLTCSLPRARALVSTQVSHSNATSACLSTPHPAPLPSHARGEGTETRLKKLTGGNELGLISGRFHKQSLVREVAAAPSLANPPLTRPSAVADPLDESSTKTVRAE